MSDTLPAVEAPMQTPVMQHTPGPWTVVAGDNYRIEADAIPAAYPHLFPGDDLGQLVAIVGNRQADFGAADAALIAAAPDLLEALQVVVRDWTEQFERAGHLAPAWRKQARAAIAKAVDGAA